MASLLRFLMRREKESRKRSAPEPIESDEHKVQKRTVTEDEDAKTEEYLRPDTRLKAHAEDRSEEKVRLPSDFFDSFRERHPVTVPSSPRSDFEAGSEQSDLQDGVDQPKFKVPAPLDLTSNDDMKMEFSTPLVEEPTSTSASLEEPKQFDVIEETFEIIEDDPEEVEELSTQYNEGERPDSVYQREETSNPNEAHTTELLDESRLVYEQLNTAYCSNFEFEHEKILKEAGMDSNVSMYEILDTDDEREAAQKGSVITSSNFGASNIAVSANENLPVGFFDDQNVDAKARGKLTAIEAENKIKELSKQRSTYLNEAKYIQEKYIEGHREKVKMENDKLEHKETLKELQNKLDTIKSELVVDTSSLKVEPDIDSKAEPALNQYGDLDYDNLSWMSRSIV